MALGARLEPSLHGDRYPTLAGNRDRPVAIRRPAIDRVVRWLPRAALAEGHRTAQFPSGGLPFRWAPLRQIVTVWTVADDAPGWSDESLGQGLASRMNHAGKREYLSALAEFRIDSVYSR